MARERKLVNDKTDSGEKTTIFKVHYCNGIISKFFCQLFSIPLTCQIYSKFIVDNKEYYDHVDYSIVLILLSRSNLPSKPEQKYKEADALRLVHWLNQQCNIVLRNDGKKQYYCWSERHGSE